MIVIEIITKVLGVACLVMLFALFWDRVFGDNDIFD